MSSTEPTRSVSFDPAVVLRPRSLDEVLDLTLAYARVYHRDFVRVAFTLVLPMTLVIFALNRAFDLNWNITWAMTIVAAPLIERVVIAYGGRHLFKNAPSLRAALFSTLRRPALALIGAALIPLPWIGMLVTDLEEEAWIGLGVMMGMFWPFVLAWSLYFTVVVLLEGVGMNAGWKRAAALISFRYGRGIAFVLFGAVFRVAAAFCADLSAQFVVSFLLQLGAPLDTITENGGSWPAVFGFLLACPYVALARLFDYVDARTRLEGWDIQIRFKAIAAKAQRDRKSSLAA